MLLPLIVFCIHWIGRKDAWLGNSSSRSISLHSSAALSSGIRVFRCIRRSPHTKCNIITNMLIVHVYTSKLLIAIAHNRIHVRIRAHSFRISRMHSIRRSQNRISMKTIPIWVRIFVVPLLCDRLSHSVQQWACLYARVCVMCVRYVCANALFTKSNRETEAKI